MCSIVDDLQTIGIRDTLYPGHIAWIAIAMHRQNCRSARCDGSLDARRIKIACFGVYVNKHGLDIVPYERMRRCNKRVGRGNDFTGYTQGLQGGYQPNGSIREEG